MRDVVVIGWGRPGEKRVSFIKLIRDELALGLADAKARFEALLGEGAPVVIPASTPRSFELARAIAGFGGQVRVLSGHANARVQGLLANEELADIRFQLEDLGAHVARRDWMSAIEGVRPDLAVAPADPPRQLAGYELARANCGAVADYRIEPQPETDWTGNLPLPLALAEYYEKLGPMDLSLEALGNPYSLPSLKNLWARQAGYRWVVSDPKRPLEGPRVEAWHDDWIVVGREGADPFILSRATGAVLRAEHGRGTWEPEELFESLEEMAAVLTTIGAVCASAGEDLADDDGSVRPRWRASLEADVDGALGGSGGREMLATLGFG